MRANHGDPSPARHAATPAATYTVIADLDQTSFHVAVLGDDGTRQTLLGFETHADARAWIAYDKGLSTAAKYLIRQRQGKEQDEW
jgi:hypothetical protein